MADRSGYIAKILAELMLVVVLLAVILGLVGTVVLYKMGAQQQRALSIEGIHRREGIPVETDRPVRVDFRDYLEGDGNVVADRRTLLRSKLEERVEAVHVREGEPVEKGQLLVEFRTEDIVSAVEAARAAYEEAASNFRRYKNLREQEVISENRLEQARTAVENASARLREAESNLAFARIHSPIDGYVGSRMVEPGEFKSKGNTLLSVVDLSTVEVRALVPEQDISDLQVGQEGEFQLETGQGWHTGRISRISPATDDPNRFFDAFLTVQNERTDGRWLLRPGMYAEVRFVRRVYPNALAVSNRALAFEGDQEVVYVVERQTVELPVSPNPDGEQEQDADSAMARLKRGWARLSAKFSPEPAAGEEERLVRREVLVARRMPVQTGVRREGLVQLPGEPIADDARVICNPREAVDDGVRVRIASGGAR